MLTAKMPDEIEAGQRVFLRKNRQRWQSLPARIQHAIKTGVDRLTQIRAEILASSRVAALPPVDILDVGIALLDPKTRLPTPIHGYCAPCRTPASDGTFELAAVLPAPTIIHANDSQLRGALLHEFAHCFHSYRVIVDAIAAGRVPRLEGDATRLMDPDFDRSQLDPPELWFAPEDVAIFPYQHNGLLADCTFAIITEWFRKRLPTQAMPAERWKAAIGIPPVFVAHIQSNPAMTG
jgi:hypothetical protein